MKLWLTRPQEDSAALAAELATHGIASIIAPVVRIAPCPVSLDERPDALLLTSRHAAHALPEAWHGLPVFCVGAATAEAVQARGYTAVTHGDGDALHLLPRITETLREGSHLLYLSGADTRHDISRLLAANGIRVSREIAYEAVAETALTPELRLALASGEVDGAVFFSPRSAQLACGLLKEEEFTESPARMDAYCLSLAVAEQAGCLPWRQLKVSHRPSRAAMVAMIAS